MSRLTVAFFIFIILSAGKILPQDKVCLSGNFGAWVYNSENKLKISKGANHLLNYAVGFSYQKQITNEYSIKINYSLMISQKNSVLTYYFPSGDSPELGDKTFGDVRLLFNTVDLSLLSKSSRGYSVNIGPSFSIVNRSILFDKINFEDRLTSFCAGLLFSANWDIKANCESTWYYRLGILSRFLMDVSYDPRGRELNNYEQYFLNIQIECGIGFQLF